MGQLSAKLRGGGERLTYWCQGCEEPHQVRIRQDGQQASPAWGFNGNYELPTFTPSVLVTYRHPKGFSNDNPAPAGYDGEYETDVCHTFITDGVVQFLGDCTHALAGQTLPLPDLPEHMRDDRFHDG